MPFPTPAVFSAISAASKLAWLIYEKGFRSHIPYDQDYAQLANAVREFSVTLQNIQDVFTRATEEVDRQRINGHVVSDLSLQSFKTIVGDFEVTLEDCRKLLDTKESYARGHGGITAKLAWNMSVAEEVRDLRDRITFHHTRLSQTLQPVKITLALSLREAMQEGFREIRGDLAEIRAALGLNPQDPDLSTALALPELPTIPEYLKGRFDNQEHTERDLPVSEEVRISSVMGHLAAVPTPETAATTTPRSKAVQRYVNLMKAAWILEKSNEVVAVCAGTSSSLTAVIWRDLRDSVIHELSAFDGANEATRNPSTEEISGLPSIQFALWLFQPGSRPLEPKIVNFSETLLLEVPLEAVTATERQQLMVVGSRLHQRSLRMVTSFIDSVGRSRDRITYHVNPRTAVLQPTYAQPDAELFNVQLRTSAEDQLDTTIQFRKLSDLFKFQRCLTGFEVKHDQPGLTSVKFKYSGFRKIKSMDILAEHRDVTRVQIWYHKPVYDPRRFLVEPTEASQHPYSPQSPPQVVNSTASTRKRSKASSSGRSQTQSIEKWALKNAPSSLSPTLLANGTTAQQIPDLEEPKVVIFLAISDLSDTSSQFHRRVKKLQYFTFSLHDGVYIDPSSCKCRNDDQCKILVVRSKGALNARLYDCQHDLKTWNLAALGQSGHSDSSLHRDIEDLDRIVISFGQAGERQLFGDLLERATDLYEKRREEREISIRNVQHGDIVR